MSDTSPPDGNVTTRGSFDVNDDAFVKALRDAARATEHATRERLKRQAKPGFFVAPKDILPPR